MSRITTYILDSSTGKAAAGVAARLERRTHTAGWQAIAEAMTDADGRINELLKPQEAFLPGHYRLVFDVGPYFLLQGTEAFFPQISIVFTVKDTTQFYHVPLILSPFGYSTYRGR